MSDTEPLTPEERENLVAYLDGELEEPLAQALEAKLSRSAAARREAEALRQTWDMLDYLPRAQAPSTFTSRTLERLEQSQLTARRHRQRRRWAGRLAWAAAMLAAAVLGFLAVYTRPRAQPPLPTPEELRVLEHREYWPYYETIDSLEFLQALDQPDLFGEDL
jgi:anti-sigma factor RsiW